MTNSTAPVSAPVAGAPAKKTNTRKSVSKEDRRLYATREEAEQHKPQGKERWRLFQIVAPDGSSRYGWAGHRHHVMWTAGSADGYRVTDLDRRPSREKVSKLLAGLSPEDRAILIAAYVPAPNGQPAPEPTEPEPKKPTGRKAK